MARRRHGISFQEPLPGDRCSPVQLWQASCEYIFLLARLAAVCMLHILRAISLLSLPVDFPKVRAAGICDDEW
jgi:hypothetical protein